MSYKPETLVTIECSNDSPSVQTLLSTGACRGHGKDWEVTMGKALLCRRVELEGKLGMQTRVYLESFPTNHFTIPHK
jgi:hypothetical protein